MYSLSNSDGLFEIVERVHCTLSNNMKQLMNIFVGIMRIFFYDLTLQLLGQVPNWPQFHEVWKQVVSQAKAVGAEIGAEMPTNFEGAIAL